MSDEQTLTKLPVTILHGHGIGWRQGFAMQQRLLCVSCGRPTRYIFQLLGCRLCPTCEQQSSRYSLVTYLEAVEAYGMQPTELTALPSMMVCTTRMFLRSHVLAAQHTKGSTASQASGDEESDSDACSVISHNEDPAATRNEEMNLDGFEAAFSDNEKADVNHNLNNGSANAAEKKTAEKAARKAAKKQAKLDQRLKRQGRSLHAGSAQPTGSEPGGGRHGASPPFTSGPGASTSGGRPIQGRRRQARESAGTSPKQEAWCASNQRNNRKGQQHDGKKLQHREQSLANSSRARRSRPVQDVGFGQDADELGCGSLPLEGMLGSSPKQKSGWLQERERLMQEWGMGAISGLMLADND